MKKLVIISLITLSLAGMAQVSGAATSGMMGSDFGYENYFYEEENSFPEATLIKQKKEKFVSDEEKEDALDGGLFNGDESVQSVMYNSVLTSDPRTMRMNEDVPKRKFYNSETIPVFQRTRIKFMNWCRKKEHQEYLKTLEKEKQQFSEFEKELEKERLMNDLFSSKEEKESAIMSLEKPEAEVEEQKSEDVVEEKKVFKLKGKLKKNQGDNVVVLDAKNIYYVEEDDEIIAENNAVVKFPKQKITMKADKFVYSNTGNIVKALGRVKISRNGKDIFCENVQVNINEEEISFENLNVDIPSIKVDAEKGLSKNNTLYLYNGYLSSDGEKRVGMQGRKIRGFRPDNLIPLEEEDKFFMQAEYLSEDKTHLDSEKVIIDSKKDHDVLTLKNTKVFYGDNKVFRIPSLKMYMDKQHSTFEGNYPEIGSIARLGMYAGPGFVFEVPHAGTLKAIPFLNLRNGELGVGGALRYKGAFNNTELAYGSVQDIWVMKGYQHLDDKLALTYGMNHFKDEWFMGPRMAKYSLELAYNDKYRVPNSFKKGLDMFYTHRGTVGYYHNSMYNMNHEKFNSGNIGTLRVRYMAEIEQELFKYRSDKKYREFVLSALLQGSSAVYGTGDTQFIGRMGLRAHSQYKFWMQDIAYFLSGFEDETPMSRFDAYRYGTSSLRIREAIRLTKYLSLAWSTMITLSDDSPNERYFQENAFLIVLGPDDLKLAFGYDYVRKRTYITMAMSINTTGISLKYKTLEIKNPDKFLNGDGEKLEELQPEFWLIPYDKKVKAKPMQYAKVINITDDESKERID